MNTSKKPSLQPKYSEAFKLKILDDIKSRRYTITEVSLLYCYVSKVGVNSNSLIYGSMRVLC